MEWTTSRLNLNVENGILGTMPMLAMDHSLTKSATALNVLGPCKDFMKFSSPKILPVDHANSALNGPFLFTSGASGPHHKVFSNACSASKSTPKASIESFSLQTKLHMTSSAASRPSEGMDYARPRLSPIVGPVEFHPDSSVPLVKNPHKFKQWKRRAREQAQFLASAETVLDNLRKWKGLGDSAGVPSLGDGGRVN